MHGALGLAINTDIYDVTPAAPLSEQMLEFLLAAILPDYVSPTDLGSD